MCVRVYATCYSVRRVHETRRFLKLLYGRPHKLFEYTRKHLPFFCVGVGKMVC